MDAIAHELHTSRSSVSRLLSHARASGLVEIRIHSPARPAEPHRAGDPRALRGAPPTSCPVPDHASDVDRLDRVALSAARILGQFVDSNQTIGVAWGSTMSAMSRHLVPKADAQHRDRAAQRRGQRAHHRHPLRERAAAAVRRRLRRARAAVPRARLLRRPGDEAGLLARTQHAPAARPAGPASTSRSSASARRSPRCRATSTRAATSSAPTTRPSAATAPSATSRPSSTAPTASTDGIRLNERATGPDFAVLRRAPRRICVVSGRAKLPEPPRGPRRRAHHRPHRRRGHATRADRRHAPVGRQR